MLTTAVADRDGLPPELAGAVDALALLPDADLCRAARGRLAADAAVRLEDLNLKRQRDGLTPAEADEAAALTRRYERAMLVRARAAALLRQRGYDLAREGAGRPALAGLLAPIHDATNRLGTTVEEIGAMSDRAKEEVHRARREARATRPRGCS